MMLPFPNVNVPNAAPTIKWYLQVGFGTSIDSILCQKQHICQVVVRVDKMNYFIYSTTTKKF